MRTTSPSTSGCVMPASRDMMTGALEWHLVCHRTGDGILHSTVHARDARALPAKFDVAARMIPVFVSRQDHLENERFAVVVPITHILKCAQHEIGIDGIDDTNASRDPVDDEI